MNLIKQLKDNGQDYEFYPTTREMVRCIFEHALRHAHHNNKTFGDVLDIGCGTCNFLTHLQDIYAAYHKEYPNDTRCKGISQYYVIEKSRILIDRLPASAIVLGVDFHENTLIDKKVDTIFCNPPYSEYEDWTARIIRESVCNDIYLIIPQRWKNSDKIKAAIATIGETHRAWRGGEVKTVQTVTVIGSFDFLDAERAARAKVDIIHIDKSHRESSSGFDVFFDDVFPMGAKEDKTDFQSAEYKEGMKNELLTGKNKIEILCKGYAEAQRTLFEHFRVICGLDADILETIGVRKENVKKALKQKFEGLKSMYWHLAFDCLDQITSRLTSTSRSDLLFKFDKLLTIDFNAENVYSLVIWVIKNANKYYKSQMIDFFERMSDPDNIKNYKSNQKVFVKNRWGYCNEKHSHYTLDYRIVCGRHSLPSARDSYHCHPTIEQQMEYKIADVITVARNLGFEVGETIYPERYGAKGHVMMPDGTELFEFKLFMNDNVHLKFNKEFIKALNVEVSRELGWIHSREDIAREFTPEMAAGAEQYFDKILRIGLSTAPALMHSES